MDRVNAKRTGGVHIHGNVVDIDGAFRIDCKALEQQFITSLPLGSQFAKVEQEMDNPIPLNGNHSFEVTISYQLMGEKFLRSAIFVNLPDTQLVFRFTARKDDFEPLHREFRTSISSWHWLGPSPSQEQIAASAPAQQIP